MSRTKPLVELVAGRTWRRDRHVDLLADDSPRGWRSIGRALDDADSGRLDLDEETYQRLDWACFYAWQYRERLGHREVVLGQFVDAVAGEHPAGRVPLELVRDQEDT